MMKRLVILSSPAGEVKVRHNGANRVKENESSAVFEAELQIFTDALNSSVESDKWWESV